MASYSNYNVEEEEISYDVVHNQNLMHTIDSFVNSNEEMGDEEAAEILGSPIEGIHCDEENLCVIFQDSLEDSCLGTKPSNPSSRLRDPNIITFMST